MAHQITPELQDLCKEVKQSFGTEASVFYIDIGYRWRPEGTFEPDICVRVHCKPMARPFKQLEGVQFIYYTYTRQHATHPSPGIQVRVPVQPGSSIGARGKVGTLGLFCNDLNGPIPRPAMLTCFHVVEAAIGAQVFSPALSDSPPRRYTVGGYLGRAIPNSDIALVHLNPHLHNIELEIKEVGASLTGIRSTQLGDILSKSGRTSGLSTAQVDGLHGTYYGDIAVKSSQPRRCIHHCFRLVPLQLPNTSNREISLPGDSGSVWFDPTDGTGVGLHFSGEGSAGPLFECAFAQDLNFVFNKLNIELITDIQQIHQHLNSFT